MLTVSWDQPSEWIIMAKKVDCVLLVDDDDEDNFIHSRVIRRSEQVDKIRIANHGLQALEYLNNEGRFADKTENPRPNIIFLDINMPRMNGFEFLEKYILLEGDKKAEICIVMLTTSRNPDDMHKAQSIAEVSSFTTKPLTQDMLSEVIDQYLAKIKPKE